MFRCWIASTSGTKFSISWGSAEEIYPGKTSHVLACSVFVDGVFTERGLLLREDFENGDRGRISGYSLDAHSELPFYFEERDPGMFKSRPIFMGSILYGIYLHSHIESRTDFTSNAYPSNELNTIIIELEWCRRHDKYTSKRPVGGELPAFSLGPISATTGSDAHGDAVSLGLPELSETYLWYETIPAKLRKSKFVFHYMSKGKST